MASPSLLAAPALAALAVLAVPAQPSRPVVPAAEAAGASPLFALLVEAAGLTARLADADPVTLFAPTAEAFDELDTQVRDGLFLPENRAALADLVRYHVVPGRLTAADMAPLSDARTLEGTPLRLRDRGATVRVDGALIVRADVPAANGLVHLIDGVLFPPGSDLRGDDALTEN